MRRVVLSATTLCAFLVAVASASAHTTIIEPMGSHFPYQQWVDESKMPTPDVTITVIETEYGHGCPSRESDYVACTIPSEALIWIAPAEVTKPREVFLHEVGHNVDARMPEWMRVRYMAIMDFEGVWSVQAEPAPITPSERFAASYSECAVKPYIPLAATRWLGVGPIFQGMPTGGIVAHNRACRMLARL